MSARRPWAWPLVPLYAAGAWLRQLFAGAPANLDWPVLSVGSLSAGGAGKTPVVVALIDLLREHGWSVDVLSRGYGREGEGEVRVDAAARDAARRFGDEPVLLARRSGVPVWVGADRHAAGQAAEADAITSSTATARARHVHLLDDGFQHRRLARALDIVLITDEDLDDALLPAGNRREPLSALRRAGVAVVRVEERERVTAEVRRWLQPEAHIWMLRRRVEFPAPLGVLSAGLRPLAFCAIARPEGFAAMVKAAGCGLVDTLAFRDHHPYDDRDIDLLLQTGRKVNASGFVTTEKDAVKLSAEMRERLEAFGAVVVVTLIAEFADPDGVARDLEAHLR